MSVKKFLPKYFLTFHFLVLIGFSSCSHQAIVPEAKNVRIAREAPAQNCKNLGHVEGSVITAHGKIEDAIEDMKLDAARKGANFVQMGQTSSLGKNVAGVAFACP